MRRQWPLGILLVVVFLVYLPALRYSLVYDDIEQIVQNPRLTSWSYVPAYFTTHLWAHAPHTIHYYRPVFLLWLRLTYALLGPPRAIWHLGSILLHLSAIVSVFLLLRRLTGEDEAATFGAAFFAIHPVQTEAVAWVSAVSEPLLTIFLVLSVYFYVIRKSHISVVSLLLAALAMLTKEAGLVAPVLIFAYEWTRSTLKEAAIGACSYLLPALLCIALRVNALGNFSAGRPPIMSVSHMILTWPHAVALYALHLLWPVNLSACYEVPIENAVWPLLLLMLVLAGLIWAIRDSSPNTRFGAAWFAITLAPSLSLRYLNPGDFVHDRYLYLPLVGLALLLAQWVSKFTLTRELVIAASTVIVVLCVGVRLNLSIWRDDISLFERAIETAPQNPFVKLNLAVAYLNSDRAAEAIPLIQQAIQLNPTYWRPYYVLGQYYQNTGNLAEADRYFSLSDQVLKQQAPSKSK